jgi:hypothetical protein
VLARKPHRTLLSLLPIGIGGDDRRQRVELIELEQRLCPGLVAGGTFEVSRRDVCNGRLGGA